MHRGFRLLFLWVIISLMVTGCAGNRTEVLPAAETPPLSLVFMAGYKPQANLPFVGVYVAQEKGFFADEALEVTVEHSPGRGEHLQLVSTGKVHVTTQDAAVLLMRRSDPGLPLVSLALIGQHGQQAFAALSSSGIKSPKDWEGRTVGFKGTPPPDLLALLHAAGADPSKINLVNVGFDPRILTEGRVDVYPVFKSNEPYMMQSWGYDVTLWEADDYGVPALGLTYVTSEDTLAQQPEALARFLRAALKGIRYAEENPDEAVEIVMKYTGPETDKDHMRYMLDSELVDAESDQTSANGLGWQTAQQWQALADMLVQYDAMQPTEVEKAFTTLILEQVEK
jgi:ABC-type nitrate/sulfonate/bicarbonate transport system substrate-binding protein